MHNKQKDILFQFVANQFDPSTQATLNAMYHNYKIIEEASHQRELMKLKREIADDVISRITLSTDVQEAVKNIENLDNAINNLGK